MPKEVIEGKVSVEAARDQYGVVISRQGVEFQVDEAATAAARAE